VFEIIKLGVFLGGECERQFGMGSAYSEIVLGDIASTGCSVGAVAGPTLPQAVAAQSKK